MSEEKEIDILYLLGKILITIRKGKFFIIFITLISLILGFYRYYIARNDCTITFIAGTSTLKANELIFEMVNGLQKDIEAGNTSSLMKKLNLKSEESNKIKKINIDSLQNTNFFKINIISNDSSCLVYIKQKTINFLCNSDYIKTLNLAYQSTNQKLLDELGKKVNQLDSLQKMMLNPGSYNNKIMLVSPSYIEYVEILEKKLKLEATLNEIKYGKIINEYTYNIEIYNNKLVITLLQYGFLGIIISILLLMFRVFFKKLKTYSM